MSTASDPASQRNSAADTLRHRLRHATSEAHASLDAQLGAFDLTSRDGYRRFLEANAAALLPLEDALVAAGVAALFPDWPQRARRAAMLDDLARLKGTARPLPAPPPLDAAGALGVLYVLEGSRLGAKYLIRSVMQSPDPLVAQTTGYLGHGADDRLWQSFLAALETHGAALANDNAVTAGAHRAFNLFAQAAARETTAVRATANAPATA